MPWFPALRRIPRRHGRRRQGRLCNGGGTWVESRSGPWRHRGDVRAGFNARQDGEHISNVCRPSENLVRLIYASAYATQGARVPQRFFTVKCFRCLTNLLTAPPCRSGHGSNARDWGSTRVNRVVRGQRQVAITHAALTQRIYFGISRPARGWDGRQQTPVPVSIGPFRVGGGPASRCSESS